MEIYLSLLVTLLGALAYGLSTNGKIQELGRLAFFAGLLAFLFGAAGKLFSVIPR